MRRFGDNLLSALEHLEQEGIAHRDVKPDNIGIAKDIREWRVPPGPIRFLALSRTGRDDRRRDPPYLEPFLPDRQPPRWTSRPSTMLPL
jgi:serine/threonine protein kinase